MDNEEITRLRKLCDESYPQDFAVQYQDSLMDALDEIVRQDIQLQEYAEKLNEERIINSRLEKKLEIAIEALGKFANYTPRVTASVIEMAVNEAYKKEASECLAKINGDEK